MNNVTLQMISQQSDRNLKRVNTENIYKRILLTGAFLSIGFITNFLSLNEIFLISLQGKPIFGVNLKKWEHSFN